MSENVIWRFTLVDLGFILGMLVVSLMYAHARGIDYTLAVGVGLGSIVIAESIYGLAKDLYESWVTPETDTGTSEE